MPERGEYRPEPAVQHAYADAVRFYRLRKEALPAGDDELHAGVAQHEREVLRVLREPGFHDPVAYAPAMADLAMMARKHADAHVAFMEAAKRLYGDVAARPAYEMLAQVVDLVRIGDEELSHRLNVQLHTLKRRQDVAPEVIASWAKVIAAHAEDEEMDDHERSFAVEAVYLLDCLRELQQRSEAIEPKETLEAMKTKVGFAVDFLRSRLNAPIPLHGLDLGNSATRWAALAHGLTAICKAYQADPSTQQHRLDYRARTQKLLEELREK